MKKVNLKQAQKRIKELRDLLEYYNKKYYDEDISEISDFEYDMLNNELKNLEKQFPELITEESNTQKVGGHVKKGFEEVVHEVPLLSLQDVFSVEEVYDFDKRIQKQATELNKATSYVVETKIDGLSASLKYVKGKLVQGATRR